MSGPPFTMSKYASELDLLRDKCAWHERRHAELVERIEDLENRLEIFADGKRVPDSCDGIASRDETIRLQDERIAELETELLGVKEYREKNPLGGPAKRFDAVADAIRAGMDYKAAMEDFGLCEKSEFAKLKEHAEALYRSHAGDEDERCNNKHCEICPVLDAYRSAFPKEDKP